MRTLLVLYLVLTISGCKPIAMPGTQSSSKSSPKPGKRYKLEHDKAPTSRERIPNLSKIPNAVPKAEPKSKIGNPKSYTVFKKKYNVLSTSKGFKERGIASWYGKKFHGYKTSNGETYDMFAMTAAHKTLPLPTYVKVTNLKNGKVVIVKVNDRGPFHGNRIIDLSYAAASKLGILGTGTAHVEIEAITKPLKALRKFLQIGAFTHHTHAKELADRLRKHSRKHKITINKHKMYHVHIGPFDERHKVLELKKNLIAQGFPEPVEVELAQ